jgi:poly(A) polymerase
VKRWARARQLNGQAYGWMGGLAYTVLAASSLLRETRAAGEARDDRAPLTDDALFARFLDRYAGWGGERPVSIAPVHGWVRTARDALPVLAPASPGRNVTRSITPSTRTHWRDEVTRARALAIKGELAQVSAEISVPPRFSVTLLADGSGPAGVAGARGFVEGRLLRAVMALDSRGLRPRPLPAMTREERGAVRFVIAMRTSASPFARSEVEAAFEDSPIDVELRW